MSKRKLPEAVLRVCRDHFEGSPSTDHILWFGGDGDDDPLRLVEIDPEELPADMVYPFRFGRSDDYPSIWIAVMHPDDWAKVQRRRKGWKLPDGFRARDPISIGPDDVREEAA
ncbi:MAG: hypothetical protein HYU66_28935 [Armatimonadetes bacterium]|nr:hypothetical protein [Armatimonadota bacterium]